jgi:glycosyltransferase involved in cell wall biosynthesis
MKFSFVILTWNRASFLERCLSALLPSIAHREEAEIVVMDNGSTDATKDVLERFRSERNLRIITRDRNYGLEAYKKLFWSARGQYIVVVDDDVLEFPANLDSIFTQYMQVFPDFGYLAMNVVQNEFTNGAKLPDSEYTPLTRDGLTVERGLPGGWCSCFRRWHYRAIWLPVLLSNFNMRSAEDGFLIHNLRRWFRLEAGIIRDHRCFHACGPYYAQQFGHLDREIEKYAASGMPDFVAAYEEFRTPPQDTGSR